MRARFSGPRRTAGLLGLIVLVGCGTQPQMNYGSVDIVDVSGTVTLDGAPLPQAVITFENPADGTFSYGLTNDSGRYALQFDSVKSGTIVGKKLVRISTARKILGLNVGIDGGDGEVDEEPTSKKQKSPGNDAETPKPRDAELVPAKYHMDSTLTVEVTPSDRTFDFELTSGE